MFPLWHFHTMFRDIQTAGQLCSPELVEQMHLTVSTAAIFCITVQKSLSQIVILVDLTCLPTARQCFPIASEVLSRRALYQNIVCVHEKAKLGHNQISGNRHHSSIIISLPLTLHYSAVLMLIVVFPMAAVTCNSHLAFLPALWSFPLTSHLLAISISVSENSSA